MNLTRTVAKKDSREWSRVMKNLGYTNLYDNGGGIIHINEREQVVVLDPSIIIHLDIFENKFGGEGKAKSDLNIIKKLMLESRSMSKADTSNKLEKIYNNINSLNFFRNKEISPSILEFIYNNGGGGWWAGIAEHQNTPQWILNELVSSKETDNFTLLGLALNKNINNNIFDMLLSNASHEEIFYLLFSSSSDADRIFKILDKLSKLDMRFVYNLTARCAKANAHDKLRLILDWSEKLYKDQISEIKYAAITNKSDEETINLIINSLSEHDIDLLEKILDITEINTNSVKLIINKCLEHIKGQRKNFIVKMLSDVFQSHGKSISAEQREDIFNALKQIKNK
jgi:hypothetical protein